MASREYRVIGAFDTETTNIGSTCEGYNAFPILYQLGLFDCGIEDITPDNCAELVNVSLYRHAHELYENMDALLEPSEYVKVVLVHNLGFDMYSLAPWINEHPNRVLAKTARKPITITILDDDENPVLVFLDTLGLFMKGLGRMGEECGMQKATGDWDYMKVRTPDTPLTDAEVNYAKRDIYTLLCYVSYFLSKNPDISPGDIGCHIVTKTGIVRHKRMKHLGPLHGEGLRRTVNQLWNYHNRMQVPKTDSELFTMHTCTRGGFTFCARNNASKVFSADKDMTIMAYDATSQHPAQMASHVYPVDFQPASTGLLAECFKQVQKTDVPWVLNHWARPFTCAFNACFSFENLRPKAGTLYDEQGIFPLTSARVKAPSYDVEDLDNESSSAFELASFMSGYHDVATGSRMLFGKMESASYCELWLTELAAWELCRAYDFDNMEPIGGYVSLNFVKPTDLSLLSVMRFYKAKNALKEVMVGTQPPQTLDGLYPESFVSAMMGGDADEKTQKEYYQLAKADLNALFG